MTIQLILLPGMDGTGELFAPLLACLPLELRATVVGYPDRPANYAEHVSFAQRELPRNEPFILLGESFSGPVAVSIASAAPPALRGIILCASFLTCPHPALKLLRPLTAAASPKLVPGFIAQRTLLGRFATSDLRAAQSRALGHVSSPTLTARLRAMADVDVRREMSQVRVSTLYLQATEDRLVRERFGDEYLEHARVARVERIEGPHLLLQANPRDCAKAICDFIAASN
jgi:pimeloyl-[acyl-carrier protein] methyl ester esterase